MLIPRLKTLWDGKYHHWGSCGQTRYVSGKIRKSRLIWLVVYGGNSNWKWHAVYS